MNTRKEAKKTCETMEDIPSPNCRETCEQILAQLEEAHSITDHIIGFEVRKEDHKWPEPKSTVEKLQQQTQDILLSVVELTQKINRIDEKI